MIRSDCKYYIPKPGKMSGLQYMIIDEKSELILSVRKGVKNPKWRKYYSMDEYHKIFNCIEISACEAVLL